MVVSLISQAKKTVNLLGFTYDQPDIQSALIAAAVRLLPSNPEAVRVGLDYRTTRSGKPRDQQQFAQQLQANKIQVFLIKGGSLAPEYKEVNREVTGTGIQHSKAVLVDDQLIVGSCNWTVSSRANAELDVLVQLNDESKGLVKSIFDDRFGAGERLEVALTRPRSRSVSISRHRGQDSSS